MENEKRKAIFNVQMTKQLGNGEQGAISMAVYDDETDEQAIAKINRGFDLFNGRIKFNNERTQELERLYAEELKKQGGLKAVTDK